MDPIFLEDDIFHGITQDNKENSMWDLTTFNRRGAA
jgi:hypothetical protein